jgi:hypothetical protein
MRTRKKIWANGSVKWPDRDHHPASVIDGISAWNPVGLSRHRRDGPSALHANGHQAWWRHGRRLRGVPPGGARKRVARTGRKAWHDGAIQHDGHPALVSPDGRSYWTADGAPHRLGSPAVINPDGTTFWAIDGNHAFPPRNR